MTALDSQLQQAGLEPIGAGLGLGARGPHWQRACPLLDDFTPAELDTLGAALTLVRAAPGQALVREGERGEWMMLVLSGTVDVTKRPLPHKGQPADPAAAPVRIGVLPPGAAVGEMSMLDGEPRFATCTAIDTVEAGVITREAIAGLIREHPAVGAKLLVKLTQLLAQRLRNTTQHLMRTLEKS